MEIDFYQFIQPVEVEQINAATSKLEEPEKLKSYFDYFKEDIPYWKIRLALFINK